MKTFVLGVLIYCLVNSKVMGSLEGETDPGAESEEGLVRVVRDHIVVGVEVSDSTVDVPVAE